jgi:uncharacterized protein with HEPN domain
MSDNRLPDYLDHIKQAATDACSFVEGLGKIDFINDKRTQQAVIMNLIIIGEAATKVMDIYPEFAIENRWNCKTCSECCWSPKNLEKTTEDLRR